MVQEDLRMLTKVLKGSWMSERVQIGSTCFVQVQKVWVSFKMVHEVSKLDQESTERETFQTKKRGIFSKMITKDYGRGDGSSSNDYMITHEEEYCTTGTNCKLLQPIKLMLIIHNTHTRGT